MFFLESDDEVKSTTFFKYLTDIKKFGLVDFLPNFNFNVQYGYKMKKEVKKAYLLAKNESLQGCPLTKLSETKS